MRRRTLHVCMALALLACIASLIETSLSRSQPCPLCGGRMTGIGAIHSLSIDGKRCGNAQVVYRCRKCDYDVLEPAGSSLVRPELPPNSDVRGRPVALTPVD